MIKYDLSSLLGAMLAAERLDEVAIGVHQVEVDAVVDEVVLAGLDVLGGAEVDAVRLADGLDLVVRARQAHEARVELGEVRLQHPGVVARRVARDEDRHHAPRVLRLHRVEHPRHLVQLLRADVRAVREAEVDLYFNNKKTPDRVSQLLIT